MKLFFEDDGGMTTKPSTLQEALVQGSWNKKLPGFRQGFGT